MILFVTSLLRIVGDVALHSHVRALLYEAEEAEEEADVRLEEMSGQTLAAVPPIPRGQTSTIATTRRTSEDEDTDDPYETEKPTESEATNVRLETRKEHESEWTHTPPLHMFEQY